MGLALPRRTPSQGKKGALLLKMPWGPWGGVDSPSLGLGVLKAVLEKSGVAADVLEAQLLMLPILPYPQYMFYATTRMLGEYLFTAELEDEVGADQMDVLQRIVEDRETHDVWKVTGNEGEYDPQRVLRMVSKMRHELIPSYLDSLMQRLDLERYALVGFNCIFDQTLASIALAKKIKERRPEIVTAFGGAAFHGEVGRHFLQVFPEAVDVVSSGDGEDVIVPLFEAALGQRPFSEVHNISYRDADGSVVSTPHRNCDLRHSPAPDYDDYFALTAELEREHRITVKTPSLFVESSRGCWWGEKQHCAFCSNDAITMHWRSKPASVVVQQLESLERRYGFENFTFVDEIMPHNYWKDLLPVLARRRPPYELFYEQKANLDERRIELLGAAGVRRIQPGVESFSTALLQKMSKGVRGTQNVFTVYRCMLEGVSIFYNLLLGFPDDKPEEYAQALEILPAVYHLLPPRHVSRIRLMRFSPLTDDKERFGDYDLVPYWRYKLWFSEEFRRQRNMDLERICFFYDNPIESETPQDLRFTYQTLEEHGHRWNHAFALGSHLYYESQADGVRVADGRNPIRPRQTDHGPVHDAILQDLRHRIASAVQLSTAFRGRFEAEEVEAALDELVDLRYVIREGSSHVSLVFPKDFYTSPKKLRGLIELGYRSLLPKPRAAAAKAGTETGVEGGKVHPRQPVPQAKTVAAKAEATVSKSTVSKAAVPKARTKAVKAKNDASRGVTLG